MSINLIDDRGVWDSFLEKSPDKLLFFQWDFLKIIEKHSGFTLLPYGIFEEKKNTLLSIFPLFFYKKFGMKFLFSHPPRSGIPYIGFLMTPEYYLLRQRQKESYLNQVVQEITKEIDDISPNFVSISFGQNVRDIRPFQWKGFDIEVNYTYTVDVTLPLETIWNSYSKSLKRDLRSLEKRNLILKETDDSKTFLSVMQDRYSQQGLNFPLFSLDYLNDILAAFPQYVKMFFLFENERILSLGTNYHYNNRYVFWIGGVSTDRTVSGNDALYWELIKKAKSHGSKTVDFGGASTERLCFFKSKFNPGIEQNFTVVKKDLWGKSSEFFYRSFLKRKIA
jgi:hypothetical protein